MIHNTLLKMMIGKKQSSVSRQYIWNALGSGIYAVATLILTVTVSRTMGEGWGGIFAIALTISQWLVTIAYFEQRTYQITDVKQEFRFSSYLTTKLLTCFLMLISSVVYILIASDSIEKTIVILLMCIYKLLEGFSDVFEGEFQRKNRIDISGKALFFRTLSAVLSFIITLFISHNLILALLIMIAVSGISVYLLDICVIKVFTPIKISFDFSDIKNILKRCFPLFLGAFLCNYVASSSRIAVDGNLSDNYQIYYTAIFMPIMVINLFSGFIFKPKLSSMATYYAEKRYKEFSKNLAIMGFFIGGFTFAAMIGAFLCGIPVLSFIYAVDLSAYRIELLLLLLAGGFNAVNIVLYYALVIMRKQKYVMFGYLVQAVLALILSSLMTASFGITGAVLSYLCVIAFLFLLFIILILLFIKKTSKTEKEDKI